MLTACLKSYAHGANDTANAAGPFAAVQAMYLHGLDDCGAVSTPLWVLVFCGVGIVAVRSPAIPLLICCLSQHIILLDMPRSISTCKW